MPVDYSVADRITELSFGSFSRRPSLGLGFPPRGSLSKKIVELIDGEIATLPDNEAHMLATASVEMWHRAIHSFLLSVAVTDRSPLWASVAGYYSSHFVMRAFAYSMGLLKSFKGRAAVQIVLIGDDLCCERLTENKYNKGEHEFCWMVVSEHPAIEPNTLFRTNSIRASKSDSFHRTTANYTDHINSFARLAFPEEESMKESVQRISRMRGDLGANPSIELNGYPDIINVQILAFQRIVAYRDFFDQKILDNRFWKAHRTPQWCRDTMLYQMEAPGLEIFV